MNKSQFQENFGELIATFGKIKIYGYKTKQLIFDEPLSSIKLYLPTNEESIQIGEAQAISAQIPREMAGIYTMGSANPRSFSRAKRGIVGSIILYSIERDRISEWIMRAINISNKNKYVTPPAQHLNEMPPFDIVILTESDTNIQILKTEIFNVSIDEIKEGKQFSYLAGEITSPEPKEDPL